MGMMVFDGPVTKVQEAILPVAEGESDLTEARLLVGRLESALGKALRLRGLAQAINDPIALAAEKKVWRAEYREIETEVREAWIEARDFLG